MTPTDFLVVTALEEELEAVRRRLQDVQADGQYARGAIDRAGGGRYSVGLAVTGPGYIEALNATHAALQHFAPAGVVLCGIAAGFPEADVALGDILIPAAVVDYELAKERAGDEDIEVEHRAFPISLSYPFHLAALNLAAEWAPPDIPRPEGDGAPGVHASRHSLLGCGMKVIADTRSTGREWLVARFPHNAIGLEMEASGVLAACQAIDAPLLVVKGVQDDATEKKDDRDKDAWRAYAAEMAAAFVENFIARFVPSNEVLTVTHTRELHRIIDDERLPSPYFEYTVSVALQYLDLLAMRFESEAGPPSELLMPNDDIRTVAVHAPGGRGKSRVAREMLRAVVADDPRAIPVLVDLRRLTEPPQDDDPAEVHQAAVFAHCSMPRRSPPEIANLVAGENRVVLILDGMNEIPKSTRDVLISFVHSLREAGRCHVIATDRIADTPPLRGAGVLYATIDALSEPKVRDAIGDAEYEALPVELRRVLEHPFFLSLAVKRNFNPRSATMGRNILGFFDEHLEWDETTVDHVADAVYSCLDRAGRVPTGCLDDEAPEAAQPLRANEILRPDGQFEHDLWRDFFLSRRVARDHETWSHRAFDRVTIGTGAFEPLTMAVEFITEAQRTRFVKAVYNWNWLAACRCVAVPVELEPALSFAVRAAIAEKLFDNIENTRNRAQALLEAMEDDLARELLRLSSREELVALIDATDYSDSWFRTWKDLFSRPDGRSFSADLPLIGDDDPLVGWAAANTARRSALDAEDLERLRGMYDDAIGSDDEPIRWRVVHACSQRPDAANAEFLLHVFDVEIAHWIKYGAARAIVELASLAEPDLRRHVIEEMVRLVRRYETDERWKRKAILGEIVDAAFVQPAPETWTSDVRPLLDAAVECSDPEQKESLRQRAEALLG